MAEIVYTAREQARLDLISDKLIADFKAEGIRLTREQVENLPSVRLFVLSEHDAGGAVEEAKRLPEVAEQVRARDVGAALNDANSDLHKNLSKMSMSSRMALGHELEAKKQAVTKVQPKHTMTADEEAQALRTIMAISHCATRLATARQLGLI